MDQNQNHPPKDPRSPVNLRIKFRSETLEQFIERYAIDVSRGGIFIRTREPLAVGTQLKLDFQYQSGAALMAGEGTVVWIRELDPKRPTVPPGMGVRFDRLTAESQTVLDRLLEDKAKHDRSGVSPGGADRAGGMAVRRPSSMFAALEPEQVSAMPSSPPSIGSGAPPAASATTFPGRPSAAYIPTLSALASQSSSSPVKSATIMPPAGAAPPPAQPRVTSSSLGSPAANPRAAAATAPPAAANTAKAPLGASQAPAYGASTSNDTTVVVRLPASGAPATEPMASPAPAAGGAYRPLGTTRNPFSNPSKVPSEPAGANPRLTTLTGMAPATSAGGRTTPAVTPDAAGMMSGPLLTDADLGPDDELNEEPTQIAGRMPSFLVSDEDPTSIGPRPGTAPESWFSSSKALEDLHRIAAKDGEAPPPGSSEAVLRALGGAREPSRSATEERKSGNSGNSGNSGSMAAFGADASRARQSLDLAPPLGSGQPGIPAEARNLRSTDDQLSTGAGSAALLAGGMATLDPVASFDGPAGLPDQPALLAGAAFPPGEPGASGETRPSARRPQAVIVGLTVVALGVAAFFVFKFFASQATQTTAESTPAVTIRPAEPAHEVALAAGGPSPTPSPSGTVGEEAAKAVPAAPAEAVVPSAAGSGSGPAEAALAPRGAEAAPPRTGTTGSPTNAKAVPGAEDAPAEAAVATVATGKASEKAAEKKETSSGPAVNSGPAEPASVPRKAVKHKPARVASTHETDAAPVVVAAADKAATPAASRPPAAAPADEAAQPSEPAAAAAGDATAASGHQIRVTSKPVGADVAIDGQVVGQTPLSTSIADVSAPHFLSVRKDGFEPFEQMISSTSAWAKTKATKGQVAVPTLKINAKLKATGGGGGDAKTPSPSADGAPVKEAAPAPKSPEDRTDRPLAPAGDERAPVVP